jgi:hypothetical protein
MHELEERRRDAAAAGILIFHGAACVAACGSWGVFAVTALIAWGLLRGNRTVRIAGFSFSAFVGLFGAFGLARYALRVAGAIGAPRPPAPTVWVAYFTGVVVYCLALAVLLAPRRSVSPASPCP